MAQHASKPSRDLDTPAPHTEAGRASLHRHKKLRHTLASMALGAAIVVLVVLWPANHSAERAAIRLLSAPERSALYERTLLTLQTTCNRRQRPEGLERYCAGQAKFILQFPECDQACLVLARTR